MNRGKQYKNSLKYIIKCLMDNEPKPLDRIREISNWLSQEVKDLKDDKCTLQTLKSIVKSDIDVLAKEMFSGILRGVNSSLEKCARYTVILHDDFTHIVSLKLNIIL